MTRESSVGYEYPSPSLRMTVSSTVVVKYERELFRERSERVLLGEVEYD